MSPRLGSVPIMPYIAAERSGSPVPPPPSRDDALEVRRLTSFSGNSLTAACASETIKALPILFRLGFLTNSDGLSQVAQEIIRGAGVRRSDGHVQAGRKLLAIQVPAAQRHLVADFIDVEPVGSDGMNAHVRVAQHLQPRDGRDPLAKLDRRLHHRVGQRQVAFFAQEIHHGPRRRDRAGGPGPGHGGRGIDAARPIGIGKELVAAQVLVLVEDDRRAFGRVTILVQVRRHGRDARHVEIELGHGIAQAPDKGQHQSAHARIHVKQEMMFLRHLRQLGNRVNDAVRIGRRRADHEDRARRDGGFEPPPRPRGNPLARECERA